jgi:hypothetical protein
VQEQLLTLLHNAVPSDDYPPTRFPDPEVFDRLEERHYTHWSTARAEHGEVTHGVAQYRRESLKASYEARMALLGEQLSQANDDKIRRMRQSQLETASADYARRMSEIDESEKRTDIVCQIVAYGVLVIEEI